MKVADCKLKINQGFSLVEAAVFLIVLLIGFIVFFRLVNSSILTLKTVKEQVMANFLAQEGLQLALAKRNQNFRNNQLWLNQLWDSGASAQICLNPDLTVIANCDPTKQTLYLSNNVYSHTVARKSIFSRVISLIPYSPVNCQPNSANDCKAVSVTSTVSWGKGKPINLNIIMTQWSPQSN